MPKLSSKVIHIADKTTSIRLAEAEWDALELICERENIKKTSLLNLINDYKDKDMGLTCSVRLFSLIYMHHWLLGKQQPNYGISKIKPQSPIFDAIKGII